MRTAFLQTLCELAARNERLWLVLGWTIAVAMLPLVLEWTGVMNESYAVSHGAVVSFSDIFDMHTTFDKATLIATNLLFLIAAALIAVFLSRRRLDAQRQLQIQAWHLRQLLPSSSKRWQTQLRPSRRTIKE